MVHRAAVAVDYLGAVPPPRKHGQHGRNLAEVGVLLASGASANGVVSAGAPARVAASPT